MIIILYVISTIGFCTMMSGGENIKPEDGEKGIGITATDLGAICISTAYPSMNIEFTDSRDNENSYSGDDKDIVESEIPVITDEKVEGDISNPKVLIIHTHATESYLPTSEGNFHTKDETNTVRDVGNTLEATLKERGIGVVHDKTLHDYPSYNASYSRSYETTRALLEKYPTIECIIDLHRDAMSSTAPAATISVGGKTCAKYSYVIGQSASTYEQNKTFVGRLNSIASSKYSGFTGAVIERGYSYNQDLSSKYLLLEIGFNRNQIEDCRNTAWYFGNVLADALK